MALRYVSGQYSRTDEEIKVFCVLLAGIFGASTFEDKLSNLAHPLCRSVSERNETNLDFTRLASGWDTGLRCL